MHRIVVITVKTRRVFYCGEADCEWMFGFMRAKATEKVRRVEVWYNLDCLQSWDAENGRTTTFEPTRKRLKRK